MPFTIDENTGIASALQNDFSGGMNLFLDENKVADNEYRECFNLHSRSGSLEPVRQPRLLANVPAGKKQGIYGFDTFFVAFIAGRAYVQVVGTDTWVVLPNFQMDATVDYIYAQAVPASTIDLIRTLQTPAQFLGTQLNPAVNFSNTTINGTVAGLVCQDGINQPRIIFPNKSSRAIQKYDEWTQDAREYVPIGKQMAYHPSGILFVMSPDGKKLLRSVTGRPLDFVVNVDINGNKGGDAYTVSYSVSFVSVNCIAPMNSGQLFVGTEIGCFAVSLNYDSLIFGEPTFTSNPGVFAGITNQFSFADILGDYAFIDFNGMRSFNAVLQLQNEGRNSVFSIKVEKALKNIVQSSTATAAATFDNFGIFAVETIYGFGLLVYDTIRQIWVSFDTVPEKIKMLAVTTLQSNPRLFGISEDNVYEFYDISQPFARSFIRTKSQLTPAVSNELKPQCIRGIFRDSDSVVNTRGTLYCNKKKVHSVVIPLEDTRGGILYSVDYPIMFSSKDRYNNLRYDFQGDSLNASSLAASLSWQNGAALVAAEIDAELVTAEASTKQQDSNY